MSGDAVSVPSPVPMVFCKVPSSICGPRDDIVVPRPETLLLHGEHTVAEPELAFVMSIGGTHIPRQVALDHVAGVMVAQDVSEQVHEFGNEPPPWLPTNQPLRTLGKGFDTFCPTGPYLVILEEAGYPGDLRVTCRVNGKLKVSESTAQMLLDVAELVAALSSCVRLAPGDICLTGTPCPIGGPSTGLPRIMPGDVVETEITGLGAMQNSCRRAAARPRGL